MANQIDKNLQRFYNSFTEMLQGVGILIPDYGLYKAKNPTKANSEQSGGVPNFGTLTEKSGQSYGSY